MITKEIERIIKDYNNEIIYNGYGDYDKVGKYYFFTDKQTMSTFALKEPEISIESINIKLKEMRSSFESFVMRG